MSFKNKIGCLKNKYLSTKKLSSKYGFFYGLLLIIVLAVSMSLDLGGIWLNLNRGITDTGELIEVLIKSSILSFILGVVLIIILSPLLSKKLLKPLEKLTKAAQEVSAEKLDGRINYDGHDDELKILSDSFDNMLDRLRVSFDKQNQFISDVSHELKTPISVISGYCGLLERWGKDDEETRDKAIATIKAESSNMNDLVNKLLYITKADSGISTPRKTVINTQELLNEVIEETKLIETSRSIASRSNDLFYIYADIGNIKELLRILIDNAIKYTPDTGTIDIYSVADENKVSITILDNGPGISDDEQKNIFDRFYRIDKSRNKKTGGTGLGLAIAKSIAKMNDAEIFLESELDKGSAFTIEFDRHHADK